MAFLATQHIRERHLRQARVHVDLGMALMASECSMVRMREAQGGKPLGARENDAMLGIVTQDTFLGADVLRLVVRIAKVAAFAGRLQRVLDERSLGSGRMTLLARRLPQTYDVGPVRHDKVAFHPPGKEGGGVLTMAKETLRSGRWRMAALDEDISVASQTLTDLDPFEILRTPAVFTMAHGACLIIHVMILAEKNRPMTGDTPVGHDPRPWPVAIAAASLE